MPEPLKKGEVDSQTDPTIAKQFDTTTPKHEQIEEFYKTVDGLKVGLLSTNRPGIGPVARSMAIAQRKGPDFYFLANKHSQKFKDLDNDKTVQITFQNSSSQDWASVTGEATLASHDTPKVKDLYSPTMKAWFGDLGDGVHNGTADDPRMAVIEVTSKFIVYWKSTVGTLGFLKEVGVGALKGEVAQTGITRHLEEADIKHAREG
ncbi:MAG: hypothetical protein M1835_003295 [Candelina submexicana]|nr:MAG: hypothetical protein M1835_003295 [Candelina submexicana]